MSRFKTSAREREKETSKLSVESIDANGTPFQEETETYDISEGGLSFFLRTPIWVDTHVTLEIASSSLFGPHYNVGAKVVRLKMDSSNRQFVAVRFD